jgi:hypothetical protein
MLLFVASWSFGGYGEHPYDPSGLSHRLAGFIMIVSIGALTLTLCRALLSCWQADRRIFWAVLGLHPLSI